MGIHWNIILLKIGGSDNNGSYINHIILLKQVLTYIYYKSTHNNHNGNDETNQYKLYIFVT